jgi:hypothetical protein
VADLEWSGIVHRCGVWLAGHGGDYRGGIPIGADRDDFAVWIAFNDVYAFEDDVFAVAPATEAGPLYGGGVACYEDVIFGESDGFKDREDSGEELTKGVVSEKRRCADRVVAFGVGRKGVDPARRPLRDGKRSIPLRLGGRCCVTSEDCMPSACVFWGRLFLNVS